MTRLATWLLVAAFSLPGTALATPAADPPETPGAAARRILKTKDFAFCRPPHTALPIEDGHWCAVADRSAICPELREMCRLRVASALPLDLRRSGKGRLQGDNAGNPEDVRQPAADWVRLLNHALLMAALTVLLILAVRWYLMRRGRLPAEPDTEVAPPGPTAHAVAPEALGEVAQLLAQARAAADLDVGRAYALLYAAALRHLELQGILHWQKATTNREYLRASRQTALHPPLVDLVREVERHRFGHATPQRAGFERLLQRIAPLLAMLLAVLTTGCEPAGDASLSGRAATWAVLRSQGIEVSSFSLPLAQLDQDSPPVFLDTGDVRLDPALMAALDKGVRAGGHVLLAAGQAQDLSVWLPAMVTELAADATEIVVADVRPAGPLEPAPGWIARTGLNDVRGWLPGRRVLADPALATGDAPEPPVDGMADAPTATTATEPPEVEAAPPQAVTEPGEVLLQRDGHTFARVWHLGRGTVVLVADERMFANGAMAVPGGAELAVAVVTETIGTAKRLAVARIGLLDPASSPADSLQKAGLWPLIVHALIALSLYLLARGVPFGVARDRDLRPRRVFAEHVRALGQHLRQRRASRLAASLYASWLLERLWQRHGLRGSARNIHELASVVSHRLQRPLADVADCLQRADEVRTLPDATADPAEDLALIRELGTLLADRPQKDTTP